MKGFQVTGWLVFLFVAVLIQPLIIWWTWDNVMVQFFNLKDVTFLDSLFISLLANALFKSASSSK